MTFAILTAIGLQRLRNAMYGRMLISRSRCSSYHRAAPDGVSEMPMAREVALR